MSDVRAHSPDSENGNQQEVPRVPRDLFGDSQSVPSIFNLKLKEPSTMSTVTETKTTKLDVARHLAGQAHEKVTHLVKQRQETQRNLEAVRAEISRLQGIVSSTTEVTAMQEATANLVRGEQQAETFHRVLQNFARSISEAEGALHRAQAEVRRLETRANDIKREGLKATRDLIEQRRRKYQEVQTMANACGDQVRQAEGDLQALRQEYYDLVGTWPE
jgi:predicted  nucleic acid-binding Zn-ribbon protein